MFKKSITLLLILICAFALGGSALAREANVTERLHISSASDAVSLTPDDIIFTNELSVLPDYSLLRVRNEYYREVTLTATHPEDYPSLSDWPQSIYYSEPNPYGPGKANGTLYILRAVDLTPGPPGSFWYVTYGGQMAWYN